MSDSIHTVLNQSAMKILRPLARVLLRNGIACGSFEELVRKAFVEEAYAMAQASGQKTTVSSISAQTGLSRKEVKRLNELDASAHAGLEQKYNRATRVISGWLNDGAYLDASGAAKALPQEGDEGSFSALVKQYSGDIPTRAMLDLLSNAGCVELDGDTVQLIQHAYVPGSDSTEVIRILGTDCNELINTIDHNLTANGDKRYQRKVSTTLLDAGAVEEFEHLSASKAQALLEELDSWLTQHETDPDDNNARYVSLGIYYYEPTGSGDKE